MKRRFSGRHMAIILVGFFGVVFAVNFTMAGLAHSTFGGIVVKNSYVASQKYNGWLAQARAQDALGWDAETRRDADGLVHVTLEGPGPDATVAATARHPLGRAPDRDLSFSRSPDGNYISDEPLPPGRWTLRLDVRGGDAQWRREVDLR